LFAVPTAIVAWLLDKPGDAGWMTRWIASGVSLVAAGSLLRLLLKRDVVPDWLRKHAGDYCTQDGFAFIVQPVVIESTLHFEAWFQNQFERPCDAVITLRPGRGFFMNRADIEEIRFEIACGPASFGVARLPVPLKRELYGKRQEFEVRAERRYPDGKGKRLRFHPGMSVGAESAAASNSRALLSAMALLTGTLVFHKTARAKITLPMDV
ncbi:unnamed protein product, partial [Ectocarpus sp. 4 AP-2014]